MIAFSHKAKHYGWIALKGIILIVTVLYVVDKLSHSSREIEWLWKWAGKNSSYALLALYVAMASTNWLLEAQKWRIAASEVRRITFRIAWKQSLMALTASLATPQRIGEYGAKAMFVTSKDRKKIMLLNFASQSSQMAITLLMGIVGLVLLKNDLFPPVSRLVLYSGLFVLFIVMGLVYRFRKTDWFINGASPLRIWTFYRNRTRLFWVQLLGYSLLRYLCFSGLFYITLLGFGVSLSISEAFPLLTTMYLLVSIIPSFVLLDVVIRSGVAVWLFSFYNIQEIIILGTVFTMWFLNVVLPALLGSWYLVSLKKQPL